VITILPNGAFYIPPRDPDIGQQVVIQTSQVRDRMARPEVPFDGLADRRQKAEASLSLVPGSEKRWVIVVYGLHGHCSGSCFLRQ
jgi:hypothetical protein